MLATFLKDVKDFRRLQGQRYTLHHILLFSCMGICCNANTYRQIQLFIATHFDKLKHYFELTWKSPPHYTTIRNHIKGVDPLELEAAFRAITQSLLLPAAFTQSGYNHIAVDGKVLCGSSDPSEGSRLFRVFHFLMQPAGLY